MDKIDAHNNPLVDEEKTPPLTTYEIGKYLHVDLTTVINWCEEGKLQAYKTPGGHRRVQAKSLMEFLKQFNLPVPQELLERIEGALKILVVDDEEDVRRVVRKALRKHIPHAEIVEATNGFEAGKMVLDARPRLVILDLMLPGLDGFKVCVNIRKDERFKETKILAITGQDTAENRRKILDAGADDYMAKPFGLKEFMGKIFKLLDLPEKREK